MGKNMANVGIILLFLFFEFVPLPRATTNYVVAHHYYTISFSKECKQAEWVAYELTSKNFTGEVGRAKYFRKDPKIKESVSSSAYKYSGYDRGHLCPAMDMRIDSISMAESFYTSNISPQEPGFNRGIWKRLENQTRKWAIENEHLYVVTGPVLSAGFKDTINDIPVPKYFFKVLFDYTDPEYKMIAFILPNQVNEKELEDFVVSVDSLESLSDIDFFPNLTDKLESQLERGRNNWFEKGRN